MIRDRSGSEQALLPTQRGGSDASFRLMFDHAPIAMAVIALDGRYQEVNPSMCQFTGLTQEQLLAASAAQLIHHDDLSAEAAAMEGLLSGRRPSVTVEKRYRSARSGFVWGAQSTVLVRADDGSPIHFIAQIVNTSASKSTEEALADEHRRLVDAESVGKVGSWELDVATGAVTWSRGLLEL